MDTRDTGLAAAGTEPTGSCSVSSQASSASTSGAQKPTAPPASPGPDTAKILSKNSNGTVVVTSSPNNEAELQLYRVMQRASLLAYYDTLLEMGGDDVQQLCDAGEEEFLEIMALVGMASKPLHVRRLQKALQEWVSSPALFQTPLLPSVPSSPGGGFSHLATVRPVNPLPTPTPPLASGNSHVSPGTVKETPLRSPGPNQAPSFDRDTPAREPSPGPCSTGQSPASPLQLTPVLVESQISRLADAAEALVKTLPQFEPKPHNTKKKICRDLEKVMSMADDNPRRMDEIRKYAAIYGRFDCKRKPEKPLTLHEVSVNEAAAQICRFCPALLTRRDELFPLARQVVRDSGYHYSKGHSSVTPMYRTHSYQLSNKNGDENNLGNHGNHGNHGSKRVKVDAVPALSPSLCDISDVDRVRRQERLEQIEEELRILGDRTEELVQAAHQVRQTNDLSSISTLQHQMEAVQSKQTQLLLERSDLLKQPLPMRFYRRSSSRVTSSSLNDSERHDTDDTDSQFSLSNASSPSQEVGDSRDSLLRDGEALSNNSNGPTSVKSPGKLLKQFVVEGVIEDGARHPKDDVYDCFYQDSKVQVISASGNNIIAVANPALSMSSVILPTGEPDCARPESPISLKIERESPKLVNHKPD